MALRCVLDCDPGHDDAIAIIAAAAAPQLDLRAITTVAGNGTLEQTTINARKVAALIGSGVPIAAGASKPLRGDLVTAHEIHGLTALDGPELTAQAPLDRRSAHEVLSDVLTSSDEPTSVIATGPLTNVARLLRERAAAASRIGQIVLMGGSSERGNVTPAAEFNMFVDPEAAAIVFDSGVPVRMAGLNLTHQAIADAEIRRRVAGLDNAVARAVGGWLDFFSESYRRRYGFSGAPIHDACAVAWAALPDLITSTAAFVAVELDGKWTRGATVVDLDARLGHPPNTEIGMELAREPFWDFIIGALA